MSRQDIANLTFKVVGLYCIVQAIPLVGWIVDAALRYVLGQIQPPVPENMGWLLAVSTLIGPGLLGGLGIYLLASSRRLAERVFPQAGSGGPPARILAVHALAFSVVGLFVIADSLPRALGIILVLPFTWNELLMNMGADQFVRAFLEPVLGLFVGVGLFLGSHSLVRIWSRLRYAGLRDKLGICLHCGYDLTGNVSGVCPECGTPRESS